MVRVHVPATALQLGVPLAREAMAAEGLELVDSIEDADWAIIYDQSELADSVGRVPHVLLHTYEPFGADKVPPRSLCDGTHVHSMSVWTTGLEDAWRHFLIRSVSKYQDPADPKRSGMVILATTKDYAHGRFAEEMVSVRFAIAKRAHERRMIDIYGRGWGDIPTKGESRYPQQGSFTAPKRRILAGYAVNLCLENAKAPGFVTEKFYDAVRAGCVPVYYGSAWFDALVPRGDYIDLRDHATTDSLLDEVASLTTVDCVARVTRLQAHVRSMEERHQVSLDETRADWARAAARYIQLCQDQDARRWTEWHRSDEACMERAVREGYADLLGGRLGSPAEEGRGGRPPARHAANLTQWARRVTRRDGS